MRVPMRTIRAMTRAWAILMAVAIAVLILSAAQSAWRAVAAHSDSASPPLPAPAGFEAQDHIPGAALLSAAAVSPPSSGGDQAAPARGVTGTIALPAIPIALAGAAAAQGPANAIADPFGMTMASNLDRARALECLTAAIYYEAASEPDAGQSAVAQVILNRVRHPAFPATVCGVVYQGSERAGCQFSFACDGAMARPPARAAWARAARNAGMALAGYVYAPVGLATHYHTYAVTPAWNRALVMTGVVGAHLFHRWKGVWGTHAAFRQVYRGGEPIPGPHPGIVPPPVVSAPTLIATNAPLPIAPVAAETPVAADNLPPAATVLDRWKDSGKPLF